MPQDAIPSGRDAVWGLKIQDMALSPKRPPVSPSHPPTQLSCSMLDDYNLKVSYLGGFLVLVPFFVWYVGLRGNRAVRLFPSYLRPT